MRFHDDSVGISWNHVFLEQRIDELILCAARLRAWKGSQMEWTLMDSVTFSHVMYSLQTRGLDA